MPYQLSVPVAAPPTAVRDAARELFNAVDRDGELALTLAGLPHGDLRVQAHIRSVDDGTEVEIEADPPPRIPYFHWFFAWLINRDSRRELAHAGARLAAAAEGRPLPEAPSRRSSGLAPPVRFDHEQRSAIATVAAMVLIAGLGASLFSQNVDFIADGFDVDNRAVGIGSAVTRVGVVVALAAAALADRVGRRRLLLTSVAGICGASLFSGLSPTYEVFVGFQLLARGFFNAVLIVGTIVAVEEAPERGRAYAIAMVTLAWGAGGAVATLLLPLGDVGESTWRISFLVAGAAALLLPGFSRNLGETKRYTSLVERFAPTGQIGELITVRYRGRLILALVMTYLLQVLAAPSAQFTNRYLGDERGFSGLDIAVFLAVVAGIPGLLGLLWGGRLAESVGRKPTAMWATLGGVGAVVVFFLVDGPLLWVAGTFNALLGAMAATAMRAFGPELFPTEVRGTANAAILLSGLLGSATGLVVAGALAEGMELGSAIAWVAIAPVIAVALVPFLPEARARDLDVVSPPLV